MTTPEARDVFADLYDAGAFGPGDTESDTETPAADDETAGHLSAGRTEGNLLYGVVAIDPRALSGCTTYGVYALYEEAEKLVHEIGPILVQVGYQVGLVKIMVR